MDSHGPAAVASTSRSSGTWLGRLPTSCGPRMPCWSGRRAQPHLTRSFPSRTAAESSEWWEPSPLSTVVLDVLHFSLHAAAFHSAVCSHPGRIVQLKNVGVEPCDALMLAGSTLEDAEAAKNAGVDSLDLRQLSMGAKASDCVNPFGNDPTPAGAGYAGSVSNRRLTLQWGRGVALCRRCSQAERGPELRRAWQPPPRHPLLGGQG